MKIHLAKALEKRGLTQAQLARAAHVSEGNISRLIHAPRADIKMLAETLLNIAAVLKVDPRDLVFGVDEEPSERKESVPA